METERDRLRRSVCGSHRDQITGLVSHAVLQNLLDALAPTSTGPIRVSHKGANESVSAPSCAELVSPDRCATAGWYLAWALRHCEGRPHQPQAADTACELVEPCRVS
jgi:hypothetical protein